MLRHLGRKPYWPNVIKLNTTQAKQFPCVPSLSDPIPWRTVFTRIRQKRDILINPEIHHRNSIPAAKEFCCQLWQADDADAPATD
jgi:hypothetical protein